MRRYLLLWLILSIMVHAFGRPDFVFSEEGARKTYQLSLKEVTDVALLNNFDIQLTKYDAWIARTERDVARSIYDTIFEAEVK